VNPHDPYRDSSPAAAAFTRATPNKVRAAETDGTTATPQGFWPTHPTPLAQPRRDVSGRAAIQAFLERKWAKEHEYRLIKEFGL
jgi:hypothetical protein